VAICSALNNVEFGSAAAWEKHFQSRRQALLKDLAAHGQGRVAVNQAAQALAEQGMVIPNKEAALFGRRFPHTGSGLVFSTPLASSRWRRGPPPRGNSRETGRKRQAAVVPEPGWLCKFKVAHV
jgi:hypothetical protein